MNLDNVHQDFKSKVKDLKRQFRENAAPVVQAAVRELKERHGILAVTWNQYTPYFNDGDECKFNITEVYGLTKECKANRDEDSSQLDMFVDESIDEVIKEIGRCGAYSADDYEGTVNTYDSSKAGAALKKFQKSMDEDIFLALFGDHVTVVVTPTDTYITTYEHE